VPLQGEAKRAYMRRYMREYRARRKTVRPAPSLPPADPEHLARLAGWAGQAVATPAGKGVLLAVQGSLALVQVPPGVHAFPAGAVGLW
jgi:hypothetical protein